MTANPKDVNTSKPRIDSQLAPGTVRLEVDGEIGWLVFDHQARRNSMTLAMWQAVPALCAQASSDESIRVVVMRGAGERAFVAGADISQFSEQRTPDRADAYSLATAAASTAIEAIAKPVIAMIHGYCIGGGLALALAADVRYAAEDSQFALPPAKLGIGYGADGISDLVDLVGPSVTKEIIYTANLFDASTALRWGLINQTAAKTDLEAFVRAQCATMATLAPLSQLAAKISVASVLAPDDASLAQRSDQAIDACMRSSDYAEGVEAFLAKRSPAFRGH